MLTENFFPHEAAYIKLVGGSNLIKPPLIIASGQEARYRNVDVFKERKVFKTLPVDLANFAPLSLKHSNLEQAFSSAEYKIVSCNKIVLFSERCWLIMRQLIYH